MSTKWHVPPKLELPAIDRLAMVLGVAKLVALTNTVDSLIVTSVAFVAGLSTTVAPVKKLMLGRCGKGDAAE
jgi:hypothetical protein